MKKRYINPETTIVTLKYQTALLIVSGPAVEGLAMPGGEGITYDGDGFEDGEYKLEDNLTRAQFATFLVRYLATK